MRTTDELCELINSNPISIVDIDWADETDNFDISRMRELILGLNEIELVDSVVAIIVSTWELLESQNDPRCYFLNGKGEKELKFPDRRNFLNEPIYIGIGIPHHISTRSISGVLYRIKAKAISQLLPIKKHRELKEKLLNQYSQPNDARDVTPLPEELQTERALELLTQAKDAGWLDENWQPTVSYTETALLAKHIANKLGIKNVWVVFGKAWNRKESTIRTKYNEALDQRKSLDFQDKIKEMIA